MIDRVSLRYLVCHLVLCAGTAVGTWAADIPVNPPAQPTQVTASFFFSRIENVDSANETFNADFYLLLGWDDQRLLKLPFEQMDGSKIWQPKVEAVNSRDLRQTWEPYYQPSEPGRLRLVHRFAGTFAAPMDLHEFPFDHHVLPIEIESQAFTSQQMVFGYPGNRHRTRVWTAPLKPEDVLGDSIRLPEWNIEAIQVCELEKYYRFVDSSFSRYRIEIEVSRRPGYYVWKVISIAAMIVVLSWVVFLLDAGNLSSRFGVSITLLLATVAFRYVVSEITPRVSYLTLLDWFLLGCFVLIFLSALETVAVHLLQRRGKGAAVTRIDRWSLAAFPLLFLLLNFLLWAPVLAGGLR